MPTLDGFPDITEIVDNERYDIKKQKCNLYVIIDVQYVVPSIHMSFRLQRTPKEKNSPLEYSPVSEI